MSESVLASVGGAKASVLLETCVALVLEHEWKSRNYSLMESAGYGRSSFVM